MGSDSIAESSITQRSIVAQPYLPCSSDDVWLVYALPGHGCFYMVILVLFHKSAVPCQPKFAHSNSVELSPIEVPETPAPNLHNQPNVLYFQWSPSSISLLHQNGWCCQLYSADSKKWKKQMALRIRSAYLHFLYDSFHPLEKNPCF